MLLSRVHSSILVLNSEIMLLWPTSVHELLIKDMSKGLTNRSSFNYVRPSTAIVFDKEEFVAMTAGLIAVLLFPVSDVIFCEAEEI